MAFGVGLLLSGCIRHDDPLSLQALPPPWIDAIQHPRKPDVTGTYGDLGKYVYKGTSVPNIFPQGLAALLFPEIEPPLRVQQVRFLQKDDRLSIEAIQSGAVIAQKTIEITGKPADGSVALHPMNVFGGGGNLAAWGNKSASLSLFNGGDGRLYLHANYLSLGAMGIIVPIRLSAENWGRWESMP